LLAPEEVRALSQLRPWRAVADAAFCWATIIGAWTLVALQPAWWSVLLAIPLVGARYYALFIIGHDGLHRRVFDKAAHNDLFCDVAVFGAIGAITRLNNRNHIKHHQHLATERDPDRHKHASFNKTRPSELVGFLTGATSLLRSVRNVFGRRAVEPSEPAADEAAARYTLRDFAILGTWQLALITGLTWAIGFWAWPVLWLMPVYVFTFLGDNLRAFAEHSHLEPDVQADTHRLVTFTSYPIERFFLSPMHMNLHATHHLWPSVPYYNLPRAERAMRALPAAAELELRGSYLVYVWHCLRVLNARPQVRA
jgi:fatty acid desaturase